MKEKIYGDTNLFIRFFTGEPKEMADFAKAFLEDVGSGKYELFICDMVISEIIYVLESIYKINRSEITQKIISIADLNNTTIENRSIILKALDLYEMRGFDFIDAYIIQHSIAGGCKNIFTFDKDFKKIGLIKTIP